MQNAILAGALFAAEQLLKHAPALFAGFSELIARKSVTVAELQAERDRVENLSYATLVPASQLPPEELGAPWHPPEPPKGGTPTPEPDEPQAPV